MTVRGYMRRTALHHAVDLDSNAVLQKLLEAGVDTKVRDDEKDSALDLAARKGKIAMIRRLYKTGAELLALNPATRYKLERTMLYGHDLELNEALAQAGALDLYSDEFLKNILFNAVRQSWTGMVRLLAAHRTVLGAKDELRSRMNDGD